MNLVMILARTIEALRSGEYNQTAGVLKSVHDGQVCHCGLGVMYDQIDKTLKRNLWCQLDRYKIRWEWRGNRELVPVGLRAQLVKRNDVFQDSFDQLADWLQALVDTGKETYPDMVRAAECNSDISVDGDLNEVAMDLINLCLAHPSRYVGIDFAGEILATPHPTRLHLVVFGPDEQLDEEDSELESKVADRLGSMPLRFMDTPA